MACTKNFVCAAALLLCTKHSLCGREGDILMSFKESKMAYKTKLERKTLTFSFLDKDNQAHAFNNKSFIC